MRPSSADGSAAATPGLNHTGGPPEPRPPRPSTPSHFAAAETLAGSARSHRARRHGTSCAPKNEGGGIRPPEPLRAAGFQVRRGAGYRVTPRASVSAQQGFRGAVRTVPSLTERHCPFALICRTFAGPQFTAALTKGRLRSAADPDVAIPRLAPATFISTVATLSNAAAAENAQPREQVPAAIGVPLNWAGGRG